MQVGAEQEETKRGSKRLPRVASRRCCRRRRCCCRGGRIAVAGGASPSSSFPSSVFFFHFLSFFLLFPLSVLSSLVFSRLSRPSFPFFFSPFSVPFLNFPPSVFIGKTEGGGKTPYYPCPRGTWPGRPLCSRPERPKGYVPFLLPPHGKQVGRLCRSFWGLGERGRGEKQGRKNLILPLPRASRGRRRPTVSSKRHRFGLLSLFFLMNNVWNGAVSFKWKLCQTYVKIQINPEFVICSIKS